MTARRSSIGDELASARLDLVQRMEEARQTVEAVLSGLPRGAGEEAEALPGPLDPGTLPRREVEHLLHRHLDRFKQMVFNGGDSVELAVSGRRLKKVSRRLHEVSERFSSLARPIEALAGELSRHRPGHPESSYGRAAIALHVLGEWDAARPDAPSLESMAAIVDPLLEGLRRDGRLRLGLFVCCPVDFTHASGPEPERYLGLDMHGSVLSRLAPRLRSLFGDLERAGVELELRTIIGDTDEDDYIWRASPAPAGLDRAALDRRRDALVEVVAEYMAEPVGRAGRPPRPRVIAREHNRAFRLSAIPVSARARAIYDAVLEAPQACFDERDVEAELDIMRGLWVPGGYYQGLPPPDPETLRRIVIHKLATYAMQGVVLHEQEPALLLVQCERPSGLREKMLNAGLRRLGLPPLSMVSYFELE
ncbi:MAG: hypothetical protein KC501_01955 [Myxococcales bacterium]|nr:hypothetical protein [Myxococcales bacterium]